MFISLPYRRLTCTIQAVDPGELDHDYHSVSGSYDFLSNHPPCPK